MRRITEFTDAVPHLIVVIALFVFMFMAFWPVEPSESESCACDSLVQDLDARLVRLEDQLGVYLLKYGISDDYKDQDGTN